MTISVSAESLIQEALVGKKFISSEFRQLDDTIFDVNGNETILAKELVGKIITDVEIFSYGYRDSGIGIKFQEYDSYLFFFGNERIYVEDP